MYSSASMCKIPDACCWAGAFRGPVVAAGADPWPGGAALECQHWHVQRGHWRGLAAGRGGRLGKFQRHDV